jgi:hypothetical protein
MRENIKEVKSILNNLKEDKSSIPDKEKDILKWTPGELKSYIFNETKGMSIPKRFKFAKELDKRIKEAKKKVTLK